MKTLLMVILMTFTQNSFAASKLSMCKDKPSCVISHKDLGKDRNFLEPIKYNQSKEKAHKLILSILKDTARVIILKDSPEYIHATFTSSIFKFVDDVEFTFEQDGVIHFKSNSRKGHFDFGANKDRIEKIRFTFHQSH